MVTSAESFGCCIVVTVIKIVTPGCGPLSVWYFRITFCRWIIQFAVCELSCNWSCPLCARLSILHSNVQLLCLLWFSIGSDPSWVSAISGSYILVLFIWKTDDRAISKMQNCPEATCIPPRISGKLRQYLSVIPKAPRPLWSNAMRSQMVQQHSQVLLEAPPAMVVYLWCYKIWLLGYWKMHAAENLWSGLQKTLWAAESSVQVSGRP